MARSAGDVKRAEGLAPQVQMPFIGSMLCAAGQTICLDSPHVHMWHCLCMAVVFATCSAGLSSTWTLRCRVEAQAAGASAEEDSGGLQLAGTSPSAKQSLLLLPHVCAATLPPPEHGGATAAAAIDAQLGAKLVAKSSSERVQVTSGMLTRGLFCMRMLTPRYMYAWRTGTGGNPLAHSCLQRS